MFDLTGALRKLSSRGWHDLIYSIRDDKLYGTLVGADKSYVTFDGYIEQSCWFKVYTAGGSLVGCVKRLDDIP